MKRYQKVLLSITLALIILLGGAQIFVSFYLDKQLKETAMNRFHKATGGAYNLEIDNIDLWILGRELNISDLKITKNEKGAGTDIRATLEHLNISSVGVINYLINKNLKINDIEFINPEIYITVPGKKESKDQETDLNSMSQKLSEAVLQELNSLSISDFRISGFSSVYNRADLPFDTLASISDSDIHLYNIKIDSTFLEDERILPADNIAMTFRDIRHHTTNGLYRLSADQLEFSSANGQFNMDSLQLDPKYPKVEFAEQVGHEIDRITLKLDHINWEGIDAEQLNRGSGISSKYIALETVDLDVYRDKRPPAPPENYPPLPHEMLRSIPIPFSVDSLSLMNSNIRYTERAPETEEAGYIEFADLSATFRNLSNNEKRWAQGENPTLHAETKVMGKALLTADFTFAANDSSNQQHIKGNLEAMDMEPLNETLEPLAFVRIDDGKILRLNFEMTLGEKHAGGQVTMLYEDFKISLLNKDLSEDRIDKKVLSALANSLKIESENKNEDPRIGKVDFERDKEKSTFNYWWKSLLSGLKTSIGF